MSEFKNVILHGDAIECLRQLPDNYVHTVVTSPPYWGLRDYGVDGQIGLEKTPEEYVNKLVEVFREVKRVLRDDGTLWLNLGDTYGSPKPKDLAGIPWRVAFALQKDGWYLRSDIIWQKPNALPESVKDRPTKAHEYIFLLSKSPRYYYDADAIREPHARLWNEKNGGSFAKPNHEEAQAKKVSGALNHRGSYPMPNPKGRNKRSVWAIPTRPFKGAHFAVFPPDLIEPCILAGSPEKACPHCGAPWERVTERKTINKGLAPSKKMHGMDKFHKRNDSEISRAGDTIVKTIGWKPACQCENNDGSGRGIVLDPFFGAGTTGLVALKHNRNFIGIELNRDYVEMAKKRIESEYEGFTVGIVESEAVLA